MGAAGRPGGDGVSFWPSAPRPPRPWRPSHQRTPSASDDRVWRGRGPVRLRVGSGADGRAPSRLRPWAPLPAPALGIPGPRAPLQLPLTRRFHRRTALPRATGPLLFLRRLAALSGTWCAGAARPGRWLRGRWLGSGSGLAVPPPGVLVCFPWARGTARCPTRIRVSFLPFRPARKPPSRVAPDLTLSLPVLGSPSTLPNLWGPLTSAPPTLSLTPVPSHL